LYSTIVYPVEVYAPCHKITFYDYSVRLLAIESNKYYLILLLEELQRRGYYDDLKNLIETMYHANGNRKVAIVAHSMGAPVILYFFTQSEVITQAWKDQYIGNFIPLSGAWGGGNQALEVLVSGFSAIHI
jgi:hypothetical protein